MTNPYQTLSVVPKSRFRDIDMNMGSNPATGDLLVKDTEASIRQSLKNLILTNFYERPFQPFLGSQVSGSLFEIYSVELELFLREHIYRILTAYEPRAEILDVRVGHSQEDQTVKCQIDFVVTGTFQESTFEFVLERVR